MGSKEAELKSLKLVIKLLVPGYRNQKAPKRTSYLIEADNEFLSITLEPLDTELCARNCTQLWVSAGKLFLSVFQGSQTQ